MRKVDLLSIVVPCHNEQEVLPATHARLSEIMARLQAQGKTRRYELVYVDNGSTDDTNRVMRDLFDGHEQVRVVSLRRNFGYQGSISAGLNAARGDVVVTIDADLQDPPDKIEDMVSCYEQGFDLVLGVRGDRSTDSLFKRFFTFLFYTFAHWLGMEAVPNHGDFRLMARPLVDAFNSLGERNRFIRAMILKLESRYAVVTYRRERRKAGRSKFGIHSLFSLSLDGIISFSAAPLRLASWMGLFMCLLSVAGIAWVLWLKFSAQVDVPGWASILLPIFGLSGFQLLFLGLIGEYLGRLYVEVKKRPVFVVREEWTHT